MRQVLRLRLIKLSLRKKFRERVPAMPGNNAKDLQKDFNAVESVSGKISAVLMMIIGLILIIYGSGL